MNDVECAPSKIKVEKGLNHARVNQAENFFMKATGQFITGQKGVIWAFKLNGCKISVDFAEIYLCQRMSSRHGLISIVSFKFLINRANIDIGRLKDYDTKKGKEPE